MNVYKMISDKRNFRNIINFENAINYQIKNKNEAIVDYTIEVQNYIK